MENNQYSFYLEGFVLASMSHNEFVLYNLLEHIGHSFVINDDWTRKQLYDLISPDNGYSIVFEKEINDLPTDFKQIVEYVHAHFWGDVIKLNYQRKPITFLPLSNNSVKSITQKDVNTITIALNSFVRDTLFPIQNQVPFFYEAREYSEIDLQALLNFLDKLPNSYHINIIGGSLSKFLQLDLLMSKLARFSAVMVYSLDDLDGLPISNVTRLHIPCITSIRECTISDSVNRRNIAIVSNEEELDTYGDLLGNDMLKIYPYYNSVNKEFFYSIISFSKESILGSKINKYTFFLNQVINRNAWGKIYVTPHGEIYDSYGGYKIGDIRASFINSLSNIDENSIWYETRERICPECGFRHFCIPVSAYERVNQYIKFCEEDCNNK